MLPSVGGLPVTFRVCSEMAHSGWVPDLSSPRPRQESEWDRTENSLSDVINAACVICPQNCPPLQTTALFLPLGHIFCPCSYSSYRLITSSCHDFWAAHLWVPEHAWIQDDSEKVLCQQSSGGGHWTVPHNVVSTIVWGEGLERTPWTQSLWEKSLTPN